MNKLFQFKSGQMTNQEICDIIFLIKICVWCLESEAQNTMINVIKAVLFKYVCGVTFLNKPCKYIHTNAPTGSTDLDKKCDSDKSTDSTPYLESF